MLTEDYYVANKLMKGFIGSANVDTNSRLCMASSVAGHRRAFGADTVPGCYEDLDEADLLVLVGSNAAWCHPVLFQRMLANKQKRGARIVVIDPRRTDTAGDADLFLGLKPGTDTALFSGLLVHLADNGALDRDYIERHTSGFDEALARARSIAGSVAATALATGLSEPTSPASSRCSATTPRVVTLYSQGVNQSAQGTDKVNAIINCHLATGRIGKPGASPFSLTGQPNAMGGREVGGLANQLAAHMGFTPPDIDRVRRFWKAPRIATHEGLKAVQMFEAIARGEIKALWVMGTNPAVSLPDADAARAALKKLELFVVSENVRSNDTVNAGAHVLLPAQAWGEKSGTVTNSERRISRQRAFLPAPGEARPDWWIVSEVAKRLGFGAAFDFNSAADVFREHAALSAFENDGSRDFDIGALASLSDEAFDAMTPVLWPMRDGRHRAAAALLCRRRIFRQRPQGALHRAGNSGAADRDHRRTAAAAQHRPHPRPMAHHDPHRHQPAAGPASAGAVRRDSSRRRRAGPASPTAASRASSPTTDNACCKVVVSERQQRGMLFAPIHWSEATASAARVGALVAPFTDPFSGQPENKATPASIAPYEYVFRGFALSRTRLELPDACLVGARQRHRRLRLSVRRQCRSGAMAIMAAVGCRRRSRRIPGFRRRGLSRGIVCRRPHRDLPVRRPGARCRRLGCGQGTCSRPDTLSDDQRRMLLSGKSTDGLASAGPIVCACFGVGRDHHLRRHRGGRALGRRDRRAAEGRHQLRLVHSGTEAADRADRCGRAGRATQVGRGGELIGRMD